MKKLFTAIFIFSCLVIASTANAKITDGFFLKSFVSLEYSAPEISGGGGNTDFQTNLFGKQISNFENIAIGLHFRVHRYLGFNANWQQSELHNSSLTHYGALQQKARFKMDQYNLSALFYLPVKEDEFEIFAEAGVADMNSKLTFIASDSSSTYRKNHETMGLYGLGFQFMPFDDSDDAFRFSFQKYIGKLALLDSHFTTIRIGYLKSF